MLKRFVRDDESGVAAIEFALILPIMLLLSFPAIDYGRYILLKQKTIKGAYALADAVSISKPILTSEDRADAEANPYDYITDPFMQRLSNRSNWLKMPFRTCRAIEIRNITIEEGGEAVTAWSANKPMCRPIDPIDWGDDAPVDLPEPLSNDGPHGGLAEGDNLISVTFTTQFRPITPNLRRLGVPFLSRTDLAFTAYMPSRAPLEYGPDDREPIDTGGEDKKPERPACWPNCGGGGGRPKGDG
jgi:hypothetical protein